MANIKQQKKRDITNSKKNLLNASFKSSLKSALKAFEAAVAEGDKAKAQAAYNFACKKLDKALAKGLEYGELSAIKIDNMKIQSGRI